jgi:hypothetical protein
VFQTDVENSYSRIKERSKVLKERTSEIDSENSNLTPEQAEVFKTFPKYFQDALVANDIEKINDAFSRMDKAESDAVMKKCQETGLITVLNEEEAAEYMEKEEEPTPSD